jgi:Ribonuclease G/E
MNKQKISRHRPRVVAVETRGPFESFAMFKLLDGRTLFFRSIPDVVNSGDVKRAALEEQRKAHEAAQNRKHQKKHYYKEKDAKHNKKKHQSIEQLSRAVARLMKLSEGRPLTREEWHEVVAARLPLKKYLSP